MRCWYIFNRECDVYTMQDVPLFDEVVGLIALAIVGPVLLHLMSMFTNHMWDGSFL